MDSILYMQLALFLISLFLWGVIGFTMGTHVHALKRWQYNKKRFLFLSTSAALIGGLLAELSNGSPDNRISLTNLFIATFASFLAIYIAYPKYADLFIKEIRHYETIFATQIKTFLAAKKNK